LLKVALSTKKSINQSIEQWCLSRSLLLVFIGPLSCKIQFFHDFKWGSCYSIFSFMCMFVLSCFFFWPLCCLFFFDLRILITPLVSSNSSLYKLNLLDVYAIGPIVVAMGFDNVCCRTSSEWTGIRLVMSVLTDHQLQTYRKLGGLYQQSL
jgi:hypothetical protein